MDEIQSITPPMPTCLATDRAAWHDSAIDRIHHLIDVLKEGRQPVLDDPTGEVVLQFALTVHMAVREGPECGRTMSDRTHINYHHTVVNLYYPYSFWS